MIRILAFVIALLCAAPAVAQAPNEPAPATYKVKFDTSKGAFVVQVTRAWAPQGADRFYNLVKSGFFDNVRFFRVISGFMVQFGINGDPAVMAGWRDRPIRDDPVTQSNKRGFVTYAMAGPNTRTSQVFINFGDNSRLDADGFAPFGRVISGMEVVDALNAEYGEGAPRGRGPDQSRLQREGNAYLAKEYPRMDFVKKATIER
ncbi:MAG: peptidylprolyl isomerase [Rhizobiales bacterium]|nr:peptidylprolyl isomerase [Hyphomicrobiales bacterium]